MSVLSTVLSIYTQVVNFGEEKRKKDLFLYEKNMVQQEQIRFVVFSLEDFKVEIRNVSEMVQQCYQGCLIKVAKGKTILHNFIRVDVIGAFSALKVERLMSYLWSENICLCMGEVEQDTELFCFRREWNERANKTQITF